MFTLQAHDPADRSTSIDHSILSRLLSALMDRIECGVLACGPSGELIHANVAARRELKSARILRVERDCVCCSNDSNRNWLTALNDATARLRSSLISLDGSGERLMVALMPVHVEGAAAPAAIAMMGRRTVCSSLGLEMLSSSHGLTFAERRVFKALVCNLTTREIAALHGVAVATVRTQIQAVRDKLGVRSIDALLLRAAEIPPVTAQY